MPAEPDDLETEYSPSSVAKHPAPWYIEDYARRSAATLGSLGDRISRETYGPGADEYVVLARAEASAPLLVFIHGGYWQYRPSGKDSVSFLAPHFVDRGAAFAAVQYELCPDVTMDEMVAQLRQALLWIARNASGMGWRASRITVGGHSAGGHLAAMLALTRWQEYGAESGLVAGACCVSGLYELGPLVPTYVNAALRMDEEVAARSSPQRALRPGAPPLVLAVGDRESGEFKRQTRDFAARTAAQGIPVETHVVPDRDHYDVVRALVEPASPLGRATEQIVFANTGTAWPRPPHQSGPA